MGYRARLNWICTRPGTAPHPRSRHLFVGQAGINDTGGPVLRESLTQRESAGTQTLCLRSCHSLWIFDVEHRRFRRLPGAVTADIAGAGVEHRRFRRLPGAVTADIAGAETWERFVALQIDPETGSFRVVLNEDRTRVLRSWLHDEPCLHCGGQPDTAQTGEIVLHS